MHQEVIEGEHTEVSGEAIDTHLRPGLDDHDVEQIPRFVDPSLSGDHFVEPKRFDEVEQGALEVRGQLPCIVASCSTTGSVTFDQQHLAVSVAKQEKRGGNPGNSGAHHSHIRRDVIVERPRLEVGPELGNPRRTTRDHRSETRPVRRRPRPLA